MRLIYLTFCRLLDGVTILGRSRASLEAEILVLRHENAIVRAGRLGRGADYLDARGGETASNEAVNFASRSRSRNRSPSAR
jgi:hypothetical protein